MIGRILNSYLVVLIAGLASLGITVGVWQWLSLEQKQSTATTFQLEAEQRAEAMKRQFASETHLIDALVAYYGVSGKNEVTSTPPYLIERFTAAAFAAPLKNLNVICTGMTSAVCGCSSPLSTTSPFGA